MHDPPAISVILPCHNLESVVAEAISSLRAQSFTGFEAWVIDDGSDDGTREQAARAIDSDARFHLIAQPHRGLSAARNHGLDLARGAFVAFLDGDDLYARDFLRDHLAELTTSGAPWTASALSLLWPDGSTTEHSGIHGRPEPEGMPRWLPLLDACDVATLFPSAWNKLYRREVIGSLRFRDGALYEDHPFFWELACRTRRIRYLPRALYHYRQGRPGQITSLADGRMREHLDRLREVAQIVGRSSLTRQKQGLSRLATRAVDERSRSAATLDARADFLEAAAGLFAEKGWNWDRAGAPDIVLAPAPMLDPELRLSVVLAGHDGPEMRQSLDALDAQSLPVAEILRLDTLDLGQRIATARSAQNPWVALLRAGDCPSQDWAASAILQARAEGAAGAIIGPRESRLLAQHRRPTASDPAHLLMRRSALAALSLENVATFGRILEPIAAHMLSRLIAQQGAPVIALPERLMTCANSPSLPLMTIARALRDMPLTTQDRAAIFAHLAQIALAQAPSYHARYWLAVIAGLARLRAGLAPPPRTVPICRTLRLALGQRSVL